MLSLNNQQRYFLFRDVVDMRKGIDGLSGLVIISVNVHHLFRSKVSHPF